MVWIFVVGLGFTYIFTTAIKRILPTPITNSVVFFALHTASIVVIGTLMAFGFPDQFQAEPTLFILLSAFFPQAIWFGTDLSKFGYDYVMAPIRKRNEERKLQNPFKPE